MADKAGDGHTRETLASTLGALGPGGIASIGFEDYSRVFGLEPTGDELEGQRAASFATKHGCDHKVDHAKRRVFFTKRK